MNTGRYLTDFDTSKIRKEYHDVIIIGSGIAGVYTALEISPSLEIVVLTKETIDISNSSLAQGGIAVSLDSSDSPELHFKDTIEAGAGLCNEDSVWVLVREAAENIDKLCKIGVQFDTAGDKGKLALTREAAHSKNRIIHAGDSTGKEVCDTLIAVVNTKKNVHIKERTMALEVITEDGSCRGVLAYSHDEDEWVIYVSNVVICASGGFGKIYEYTTNPEVATGDGIAAAYRAGAELMDMEFVQFHPTVLFHPENKSFLISEAVRGEGAVLRNNEGRRFMPDYHERAELAPRDVVSRAIFEEMRKTGAPHVWLDITFKGGAWLKNRFPTIYRTCKDYGIDMGKDFIPVAPAEHYCMGGIKSDAFGTTTIEGFFACGECACTGIHGANRLASNSLLEGLVFGSKISERVNAILEKNREPLGFSDFVHKTDRSAAAGDIDVGLMTASMRNIMNDKAGIIRDGTGLSEALDKIRDYRNRADRTCLPDEQLLELRNMLLISEIVLEGALERRESRGAHFRSDFPKTEPAWKRNIIRKAEGKDLE